MSALISRFPKFLVQDLPFDIKSPSILKCQKVLNPPSDLLIFTFEVRRTCYKIQFAINVRIKNKIS